MVLKVARRLTLPRQLVKLGPLRHIGYLIGMGSSVELKSERQFLLLGHQSTHRRLPQAGGQKTIYGSLRPLGRMMMKPLQFIQQTTRMVSIHLQAAPLTPMDQSGLPAGN